MANGTYETLWMWPVTLGLLYLARSYHHCSIPLLARRPGLHAGKEIPGGCTRVGVESMLTPQG